MNTKTREHMRDYCRKEYQREYRGIAEDNATRLAVITVKLVESGRMPLHEALSYTKSAIAAYNAPPDTKQSSEAEEDYSGVPEQNDEDARQAYKDLYGDDDDYPEEEYLEDLALDLVYSSKLLGRPISLEAAREHYGISSS